jgi:hypothetical protein
MKPALRDFQLLIGSTARDAIDQPVFKGYPP